MPDATNPHDPRFANAPCPDSREWADAFATLPLEAPAASVWPIVATLLDARRHRRWQARLAVAAAIALMVVVPLRRWAADSAVTSEPSLAAVNGAITATMRRDDASRVSTEPSSSRALERLYAESARLEAVLSIARDDRVASGPGAALSEEFDHYLASIDTALSQPALSQTQRFALWTRRVDALRQAAGLESTQRWLAVNGDRYDGALVNVD